ncbi:MAG TPA: hypothetical protein VF017_20345 [Thermoanaerobaculia bacterium]|nr:hypothetical protein [Thermoanaerobaculia bacterium]
MAGSPQRKRSRQILDLAGRAAAFGAALALAVAGVQGPLTLEEGSLRGDAQALRERRAVVAYLRAVPDPDTAVREADIRTHSAREWYLLSYPTGRIPTMAWDRARDWVRSHVADAESWAPEPRQLTLRGDKAFVPPGTSSWVSYGPRPLDTVGTTNDAYQWGRTAGRVAANGIAVDPDSPNVAYVAFAAGGFWKTTNLGSGVETWTPLWDDKDFVTQAAGAVEIDPTDGNVLYVGTGDAVGRAQFGAGIMKTCDAGAHWMQLGASVFTPFSPTHPAGGNRWDNQSVKVIEVDPQQPSTLLVGTRADLYLSHDGGTTWEICPFGPAYTDPSVTGGPIRSINRISSIVLDDRGTSTVAYVAVGYIGREANGNNGVYRFTVPSSGCPAWPADFTTLHAGLPPGTGNGVANNVGGALTGRIELAQGIGADAQLTLYAQVHNVVTNSAEGTYVLRPDGGATAWTKLAGSSENNYRNCNGNSSFTNQDWFDLFLEVDPTDDRTLYIGHIDAFKATVNAGYDAITLTNLTSAYGVQCPEYGAVHPDQHALTFIPGSGGEAFLLGNDGGLYSNDGAGALADWRQLNDGFNTTLFYAGQLGADFAGGGIGGVQWLFGGMQDNGTASWDSTTPDLTATARSIGGDGFFSAFDPVAGSETTGWWLSEYTFGSVYCSDDEGADGPFAANCSPHLLGSADFSAPLILDALHCSATRCSNLLFGEDYVHASGAYGQTKPQWAAVSANLTRGGPAASIVILAAAPSQPTAAAAGTNDGKLWWSETVFTGAGCTQAAANTAAFSCTPNPSALWRDVDPTNSVLPNRAILGLAFDPSDHTRLYAAVGGFDPNTPTTPGHLFELKWNGTAWTRTDKTANLPDVPASAVAVNPHNRKQVFVGTHFGFYYTDDIDAATVTWVRYQHGLPNTIIRYLTIDRGPAADPLRGTTLAAFTFGRGVWALKLPTGGGGLP